MAGDGTPSSDGRAAPQDWAARATGAVEAFVELVRDKSVRPLLLGVNLALIGLVVVVVAAALLILATVGVVRLLTDNAFGGRVWISDLVVGALLCGAGGTLFRLSRRTTKADSHV